MLSKEETRAERSFDELHVRAETGLGAEAAVPAEAPPEVPPREPGRVPASAM
jgi:hypothetical protein